MPKESKQATAAPTQTQWSLQAEFIQACNCDFGCPCEFQAPPTEGYCDGMAAWRITKGSYGQVRLDGLGLAFAAKWPKAIHEGNGTGVIFIDEKANPAQREALLQIASGKAGGIPFEIMSQTFSKVLDPQFVPFEFHFNGKNSWVKVGNAIHVVVEPIKNPVTGQPESVKVVHETGFVFKEAEAVTAKECAVRVNGLSFNWPGKSGFVTKVSYAN